MWGMEIRRMTEADAQAVSDLIVRTLRVSNAKDYPAEMLEGIVRQMQPRDILERASWTHFYVAEENGGIAGCGAIGPYWGSEEESSLFTIFVAPECQGRGIGRKIVETLEADPFALRARRIEIPASITGLAFYQKLGYTFKNGIDKPDEERLYRLEKHRKLDGAESVEEGPGIEIRAMTMEDYEKVYALWMSCKNMGFNNLDDSREGIEKCLRRNPTTSFVAAQGEAIVGVILAGHDGRRGFVHHLAVAEKVRRQGIASALLENALDALSEEGIHKVALLAFKKNEAGNAFWESQGFTAREDVTYRNKALTDIVRIDT